MKLYSWDEIKSAGNCLDYMTQVLGMAPEGRQNGDGKRFNCPWRPGSDSGSFAVKPDAWYDHVEKVGGSIIDLAARAKHNGNLFEAAGELGEFLRLEQKGAKPRASSKKAAAERKIEKIYDYEDEAGITIHQKIRFFPKDFIQRRPDPANPGDWIYSLEGIDPILYRIAEWSASPWVILVEGEKDADALAAMDLPVTTTTEGAGKWRDTYTESIRGKDLIILPDNDKPGRDHANLVSAKVQGAAKSIKVVSLPNLPTKGDVSDWIAAGGTKAELLRIIAEAAPWEPKAAEPEPIEPVDPAPAADGAKAEISALDVEIMNTNRSFALVIAGNRCAVQQHITSPMGDADVRYLRPADFKSFYASQNIWIKSDSGNRIVNVAAEWLKHPLARRYDGIGFDPSRQNLPKSWFNLFRGFAIKPAEGDWSMMRRHILEVICAGNNDHFDYLINWMARICQDPGEARTKRPGVAVVLKGGQGSGKGIFWSTFGDIFRPHYRHLTRTEQLSGKFNHHLKDAIFVFADEAIFAGDRQHHSSLKAMITERTNMIEPKGFDSFEVASFINLGMATNESWCIPADSDSRRFCVLDVANDRQGDHHYFQKISKQMKAGGSAAMLHDLLKVDLSNINLQNFPKTALLLDQKVRGFNWVKKYWFHCLHAGELFIGEDATLKGENWATQPTKSEFHEGYRIFVTNHRHAHPSVPEVFFRELREIAEFTVRRLRSDDRRQRVSFPSLDQCRAMFEAHLGQSIEWDLDDPELPF